MFQNEYIKNKKLTNKEVLNHRHHWVDIYKISMGCSMCGYNKHPSALCFDHLPEQEKSEAVKNGYSKKSCAGGMYRLYYKSHPVEDLLDEMRKCRILCQNCHMEITHSKNTRLRDSIKDFISFDELEIKLKEFEKETITI